MIVQIIDLFEMKWQREHSIQKRLLGGEQTVIELKRIEEIKNELH